MTVWSRVWGFLKNVGLGIKKVFSTVIDWTVKRPVIATIAGIGYLWARERMQKLDKEKKLPPWVSWMWNSFLRTAGDALAGTIAYTLVGEKLLSGAADAAIEGAKAGLKGAGKLLVKAAGEVLVYPIRLGLKYLGVPAYNWLSAAPPGAEFDMLEFGDRSFGIP